MSGACFCETLLDLHLHHPRTAQPLQWGGANNHPVSRMPMAWNTISTLETATCYSLDSEIIGCVKMCSTLQPCKCFLCYSDNNLWSKLLPWRKHCACKTFFVVAEVKTVPGEFAVAWKFFLPVFLSLIWQSTFSKSIFTQLNTGFLASSSRNLVETLINLFMYTSLDFFQEKFLNIFWQFVQALWQNRWSTPRGQSQGESWLFFTPLIHLGWVYLVLLNIFKFG